MKEILHILLPNVSAKPNEIIDATVQTINMMVLSGAISLIFGLIFGVIVVVTSPRGILKNAFIYNIMDKLINVFRSIPFVILLAALIPFTRMVVGTAIGTKGAILPLVFGTVPFFTRQIESALYEVDKGLIEAAQSMGSSPILKREFAGYYKRCTDYIYLTFRTYRYGRRYRRRRSRRLCDKIRTSKKSNRCNICYSNYYTYNGKLDTGSWKQGNKENNTLRYTG